MWAAFPFMGTILMLSQIALRAVMVKHCVYWKNMWRSRLADYPLTEVIKEPAGFFNQQSNHNTMLIMLRLILLVQGHVPQAITTVIIVPLVKSKAGDPSSQLYITHII